MYISTSLPGGPKYWLVEKTHLMVDEKRSRTEGWVVKKCWIFLWLDVDFAFWFSFGFDFWISFSILIWLCSSSLRVVPQACSTADSGPGLLPRCLLSGAGGPRLSRIAGRSTRFSPGQWARLGPSWTVSQKGAVSCRNNWSWNGTQLTVSFLTTVWSI